MIDEIPISDACHYMDAHDTKPVYQTQCGQKQCLTAEFATMSRTDVNWSMVKARQGKPATDHESPTIG